MLPALGLDQKVGRNSAVSSVLTWEVLTAVRPLDDGADTKTWAAQNGSIPSTAQSTSPTVPGSRMSSLSVKDSKTFRSNDSLNGKLHGLEGFLIREDM